MFKLYAVDTLCKDCGACEALLSTFNTKHNKCLYISKRNVAEEEIRAAAKRLVDGCPNNAIRFREA